MWLIRLAMRRPVTIMVAIVTILLSSVLAVTRMKVDIFPDLNLPVIYVVQPYGGMDAAQMEGYLVSFYEQHFLYIGGIEHIESRSIQSASVMKIYFQPGTDMADAMAQVMAQVERSRAYMPPGTVTPFVLRFDAGNVPVGYLVLSSPLKTVGEIQDLAFVRIRPVVSTIAGVSTPPPFGGNQRSILVHANPERLRAYRISPEEVVAALTTGNTIMPSGIVRTGSLQRISCVNSVVSNIQELTDLPIRLGQGPTVFLGDIARIEDGTDIPTGYALVNGHRTVYIAISKRPDASTLAVVDGVKAAISKMQSLLPEDIKVSFEFDQSIYVTEAIKGVVTEGALGAVLTGLTVLLFLADVRSAFIVVLNIPIALLAAMVALWAAGQTINIMTMGGLALSVGILVDESTVAIENIHTHLASGELLLPAIYQACCEVVTPQLLAMLSVISVFMPSFFMVGSTRAFFVPLSLAVGFAMVASYILSNTLVPILAAWLLPEKQAHGEETGLMHRLRRVYGQLLMHLLRMSWATIGVYLLAVVAVLAFVAPQLGSEIFPAGNPTGFQLRLRAPTGTRIERTEDIAHKALAVISAAAGQDNIQVTISYVGTQPPSYAISNVYMWTSGPQEAVLLVSLKPQAHIQIDRLKEQLRQRLAEALPGVSITFEAGDIVNQIMNFGAPTPIQVDVSGPDFGKDRQFASRLLALMRELPNLRDVALVQPLDYPTIDVRVDRKRAGQLGVTVKDVGRSLVEATYSSRFVEPIFWRDAGSGMSYQVQLELPQSKMHSIEDVESVPVMRGEKPEAFVRDLARVNFGTMPGEYDRYNMQRMLSITANLAGNDLGRAATAVAQAVTAAGNPPRGVTVNIRGQVPTLRETSTSLEVGLAFAIVVILLMLIAYFQSLRLPAIVASIVPAIGAGVVLMLWSTGTTLNVQSFMGAIMAMGIGVANAILVVTFAEHARMSGQAAEAAAVSGATSRLRPVLMTSIAMIAGMLPMALGLGEGGERTAPLGRAVIGGLVFSTSAVLLVLPIVFAVIQKRALRKQASLLPDDVYG